MRTRMLSCYKGETEVLFAFFQYISSLCYSIPNARFILRRAAKRGEKAGASSRSQNLKSLSFRDFGKE